MELVVEVSETEGRLSGTVRRAASTIIHPFTGTLELIACLEHLGDENLEEDPDPADRADQ